jgi:hypothetical protein
MRYDSGLLISLEIYGVRPQGIMKTRRNRQRRVKVLLTVFLYFPASFFGPVYPPLPISPFAVVRKALYFRASSQLICSTITALVVHVFYSQGRYLVRFFLPPPPLSAAADATFACLRSASSSSSLHLLMGLIIPIFMLVGTARYTHSCIPFYPGYDNLHA